MRKSILTHIASFALLLIFSGGWAFKAMHVALLHPHDHDEHPVCHIDAESNTAHIHDDRFAPDECSLCAFVLSVCALPELPVLRLEMTTAPKAKKAIFCAQQYVPASLERVFGRGPPAQSC